MRLFLQLKEYPPSLLCMLHLCASFVIWILSLKVNSNKEVSSSRGIGSEVPSLFATAEDNYQFSLLWRIGLVGENKFHAFLH